MLVEDLISLLIEHEETPRVCLPLLRTLQHLLESQALEATIAADVSSATTTTTTLATRLIACGRQPFEGRPQLSAQGRRRPAATCT